MKCTVCKAGETSEGTITLTLERGNSAIVVRGVPAQICENCGEEYVDEQVAARAFKIAEDAAQKGIDVDVRQYVA